MRPNDRSALSAARTQALNAAIAKGCAKSGLTPRQLASALRDVSNEIAALPEMPSGYTGKSIGFQVSADRYRITAIYLERAE
jgi:hypothetical protein